jgi:hypothetical protein
MRQPRCLNQPLLNHQQGAALLLFFLAVLITGTLLIAGRVALDRGSVQYEDRTSEALARAKEALIAYAVSHYETDDQGRYGVLPCPESSASLSEGIQAGNCNGANINADPGRLPWKNLAVDSLKDGSGECLWYVVSAGYKKNTPSGMLNEDTPGMFVLRDENGDIIQGNTPEDRVVAVVIAPGPQLAGQARPNPDLNDPPCVVAHDAVLAADYLDATGSYDNSDVVAAADSIDDFVTAINLQGSNINDRIITITAGEIFDAIRQQTAFDTRMQTLTEALAQCIGKYGIDNVQAGGPCPDVNQCRADCDDDRDACRFGCGIQRLLCLLSGNPSNVCNQQRNDCRSACDDTRTACRDACVNCTGGADIYRLPWPAPVDLGLADYRLNDSYLDRTSTQAGADGLLGRLPFNVNNSSTAITSQSGNPMPSTDEFLELCTGITLNDGTVVDLSTPPPPPPPPSPPVPPNEYRVLYENWKDHFFYVVGEAYAPSSTNNTCTVGVNCPSSLGATSNPYAAIVFYSDERTGGQLRRSNETDPGLGTKDVIGNYLEGSNSINLPDLPGSGEYNVNSGNDYYCLIDDQPQANVPARFTVTCGP